MEADGYEGGWSPSDYDEDLSSYSSDWEVAAYTLRGSDGSLEAFSEETDAYRVYGENPDLAADIGDAQGITHGASPEQLAQHYERTAELRNRLGEFLKGRR